MKMTFSLGILLAIALAVAGCAPAATPAPPPAAAPAPQTAPARLSPEEAAWAQAVAAAQKEGTFTAYAFNYVGDIGLAVTRGFKERYGIKMEVVSGRGAEFLERLKTEARMKGMVGEIMEGSPAHVMATKQAGLSISLADLPSLQAQDAFISRPFMDEEKHVVYTGPIYLGPWINTNLIKPQDEPRTWKDLLDPKWKGKLVVQDPRVSSTPYLTLNPLVNHGALDMDYIRALGKQELKFDLRGTFDVLKSLARGEIAIIMAMSGSSAGSIAREGAPIKGLAMEEGLVMSGTGIAVIKGTAHPNAARLFVHWLMSEEGQRIHAQAKAVPAMRKGVEDFSPPAARLKISRIVVATEKDEMDNAQKFRDKLYVEFWQK